MYYLLLQYKYSDKCTCTIYYCNITIVASVHVLFTICNTNIKVSVHVLFTIAIPM